MTFVGIDPGLTGAIVALDDEVRVWPWEGLSHARAVVSGLPRDSIVALERIQPMPNDKRPAVATFKLAQNFGQWQGLLAAYGFEPKLVAPITWLNAMGARVKGEDRKQRMERVYRRARELFPALEFNKPAAAALVIAAYARQTHDPD